MSVLDIIFVSLQVPSDTLNNDVPELMTLTLAGNPIGKQMAFDIFESLPHFWAKYPNHSTHAIFEQMYFLTDLQEKCVQCRFIA